MPGFADRLSPNERWDLINFLRALAAAEAARRLGPVVEPTPALVAPDFAYTTGVGEGHALRDFRGQEMVLLVFFRLPDSMPRLGQLAGVYATLRLLGTQILAIPPEGGLAIYRRVPAPPIFFPITVDGAAEATPAYALFRRDLSAPSARPEAPTGRHMELLVDRQGYIRARWLADGRGGWADPQRLVAEVERLAREPARAPLPDEHVH